MCRELNIMRPLRDLKVYVMLLTAHYEVFIVNHLGCLKVEQIFSPVDVLL